MISMSTAEIDNPNKKRNNYFDFLRAVAIIMVIGNHTSGIADFSFPTGLGNIAVLQIIKSGVPIFLAISAFFLCPRVITGREQYFRFLTKHFKRIYIPMMIFSLPFIFGNGFSIKSIIGRTVLSLFGAYSVYYFIFLIAQYYLLLPVMQRHVINKKSLMICALISCVSILGVTYCNSIRDMDLPLFMYAGFFPVWIIFFALGCYISKHQDIHISPYMCIIFLFSLLFSIVETIWLDKYYTNGLGIKLSVFILSTIIILILFSKKCEEKYNECDNIITRVMNTTGRISFTIYLCHIYFISFLKSTNLLTGNWYLNWFIVTLICVTAVAIADLIIPKKIGKYIGL